MQRKTILVEQVRQILNPIKDNRFCSFNGLFYSWDEIDKNTWEPVANAKGIEKKPTSQCYKIRNLTIYF